MLDEVPKIIEAVNATPVRTLIILTGLALIVIGLVGKIAGKIEPDKPGRIGALLVGGILLVLGIAGLPEPSKPPMPRDTSPSVPAPIQPPIPDVGQRNKLSPSPSPAQVPLTPAVPTAKHPITADNVATKVREGLWNWTVFIQGSDDVLNQIRCVEYTLHSTFPDPVRMVCERGTGAHAFPLSTSGWGTFQIRIRVFMLDGRELKLTHDLRF